MILSKILKKILTDSQWKRLKNYVKSFGLGKDLTKLAIIYNTDKWGGHYYTPHYQTHFTKFRNQKINLLEIGVGGYDDPKAGGESLLMWKRYFPFGNIFAIDIYSKSFDEEKRIKIFKGSQVDKIFLLDVTNNISGLDIIIDDGSHINEHVIETFKILFPLLNDGGLYVIEDIQTSYWPEYGGDSTNLNNSSTIMSFFKKITDGLNYRELIKPGYEATYYDKNIVSIHFYHNLIFIYKGKNDEESNIIKNNQAYSS